MELEFKSVKKQLKKHFLDGQPSKDMAEYMKNRVGYISDYFLDACIAHLTRCEDEDCHIRNLLELWTDEKIPKGILIQAESNAS